MEQQKWLIWGGVLLLIGLVRLVKFVLSRQGGTLGGTGAGSGTAAGAGDASLARLNAAAERILKQKRKAGARSQAMSQSQATSMSNSTAKSRSEASQRGTMGTNQPRKTATTIGRIAAPAVTRRGGLLPGSEPVIQRRR